MRISKKILACVLAAMMAISMMPFTVLADEEVPEGATYSWTNTAGAITYYYGNFATSFTNNGTWKLYTDISVSNKINFNNVASNVTLDLNGHNITSTATDCVFKNGASGGSAASHKVFNVVNTSSTTSTITGVADSGIGITVKYFDFTLGENIVFNNSKTGVTISGSKSNSCPGATVIINGTINAASEFGLTVNGTIQTADPAPAVIVNGAINGSTAGIYAAGNADYTINGTVTGHTGIYQKGGNLVVNEGAVVTGTGDKGAYVEYNDGMYSTGDAIVVEDNGSYALGTTTINGGTITSTAAGTSAVAEYDASSAASSATEQDITVSGGTFVAAGAKDDISEYLIEGATQDANGVVAQTYVAKVNGVLYADFEEAVAAARTGSVKTVECLSDIDLTQYPAYGSAGSMHYIDISGVTVDLNGKTMTIGGRWSTLFSGTNGKIMNGTCVGTPSPADYQYGLYIWGPGNGNLANSGGESASIELEDLTLNCGLHTWNANVTVTDCDATGSAKYYAVWSDENSYVTIESGNYSTAGAAVIGCATSSDGQGHITVNGGNFTVPSGKKLVQTGSSSVPENAKFYGGFVKNTDGSAYTVLDANLGENRAQNMTTGEVIKTEPNDGTNITVADKITENFYLDEDFYGENAYVAVTYNTSSNAEEQAEIDTEITAMSDLPSYSSGDIYNGNRVVTITQAPAQVTEDVVINVYASQADAHAGTNPVRTITYSTYEYCTNIIETSSNTKLVELAETTLDYAAAAQDYFNYNTENMATAENSNAFYNNVASADLSGVPGIQTRPSCIVSATLVVKSDLEINLLSRTPIYVSSASIDTTKGGTRFGATASDELNGSWYVINIKGIEPANMDSTITVQTSDGQVILTANSIMKLMAKSSNAKMATLAKAMYLYGQAADAYFD